MFSNDNLFVNFLRPISVAYPFLMRYFYTPFYIYFENVVKRCYSNCLKKNQRKKTHEITKYIKNHSIKKNCFEYFPGERFINRKSIESSGAKIFVK